MTRITSAIIWVYWHRPIPIFDIKTGELGGHGKKFKDDLLQLSYKYFNHKFGLSEGQVRNALIFLEEKGLIFREFRNISVGEHVLNNVMHIGIYPEKISKITGQAKHPPISATHEDIDQTTQQPVATQTIAPSLPSKPKTNEKDWSAKFTGEQKSFLDYLLNIQPAIGDPIEKNHATWWIKSFGIEKIKIAIQVYWQQVEKAKQDSTVPLPQHIGKYVRKALNDGTLPAQQSAINEKSSASAPTPLVKKSDQVVAKIEPAPPKNETTNTNISMTSMIINEVNDKSESLTFQKEEKVLSEKEEWIKIFGIDKIKVALQVYWQQVDKSQKDSKVPLPASIGAYVREALNQGTQPCREADRRNKAFAEQFKKQRNWSALTITEKYCRVEEIGKEWYYNLPEAIFNESLKKTFENYCSLTERQFCAA